MLLKFASSLILLSSCWLHSLALTTRDPLLERRQAQLDGVPGVSSFISRAYHASVVLGDYLYIDGGEIAFYDDNRDYNHLPDNNTYSVDLTQSWTNSTVSFNTIQKSAPVMNYVSLWRNTNKQEIYAFGGEQSGALPQAESPAVPPTSLWKFIPSGASGLWTEIQTTKNFQGISRPAAGIGASSPGAGYLLGGYQTRRTSAETVDVDNFQPVPGILTYDFSSQTWSNNSAKGFSTYGTAQYGRAHTVTGFGDNPVVLFFGGETSDAVAWHDNGANLLDFNTIYIYDPVADKWHSQRTSGDAPEPRDRFCSVGVASDDASYEIFIFGGHVASSTGEPQASSDDAQKARNLARDEVFSLSIPAFNWQKANYTASWPRVDHSCNIVGHRQMMVIGGLNPALDNGAELLQTTDPWTNGIGIFDLTEMAWKDGYDAEAKSYTSSQAVKDWYALNGRYPAHWGDATLKAFFQKTILTNSSATSNSTSDSGSGSGSESGTGGSSSSDSSMNTNGGSSSNTGAIAGGVVGGVAALAIAGLLFWFLRRRKSKPHGQPIDHEMPAYHDTDQKQKHGGFYAASAQKTDRQELGTDSDRMGTHEYGVRQPNGRGPPVEVPTNSNRASGRRFEMAG